MTSNQQFVRQVKFIAYYLDRGAYTYSNFRRSALKAGYGDAYARKIGSHLNCQEMAKAIESVQDELARILPLKT